MKEVNNEKKADKMKRRRKYAASAEISVSDNEDNNHHIQVLGRAPFKHLLI